MKIGTAVGTNDTFMIQRLRDLKKNGLLDYVELYILPSATIDEIARWRESNLVEFCQAPHDDLAGINMDYLNIGAEVAKMLGVKNIIFNAGITIMTHDIPSHFWPETMPFKTSLGDLGSYALPEEIMRDFCFDIAHGWITARQTGVDPKVLFKEFIEKKPKHLHITDVKREEDHLPLGTGDIDLDYVVELIHTFPNVTIETDHEKPDRWENMVNDLKIFRKHYENRNNNTGKS